MHRRFHALLTVAAVLLLAVSVAGSGGAWHWLLDLASHFRAYWLGAAVVGLAVAARQPRSLACACCGLAVAGNAWPLLPFWLPPPAVLPAAVAAADASGPEPRQPLTLILANLHRLNPDKSRAIAYLRDRGPDVAVLLEVDAAWLAHLSSLDDIYPHRIVEPREDNFGITVLSRWPLEDRRVMTLGGTPFVNVAATIGFRGTRVRLLATHPHPPLTATYAAMQLSQCRALADLAAESDGPCIAAGDFNATPWSLPYRTFVHRSGLRDTALGHGVQPTWNARFPAPRIPIDHVFASPDIAVVRRAVGPDIGSDHFPVEADVLLP